MVESTTARSGLRVAQEKIAKLEAEIRTYKDRAERAEKWLRRIDQEVEKDLRLAPAATAAAKTTRLTARS